MLKYTPKRSKIHFLQKHLEEHFPQPRQKGMCNIIFTSKETCPHLKFCILFYRIYRKLGRLILHVYVCICILKFKIKSRYNVFYGVVKYTCRLRRYNYTHDQLNTRHLHIIFRNFLREERKI